MPADDRWEATMRRMAMAAAVLAVLTAGCGDGSSGDAADVIVEAPSIDTPGAAAEALDSAGLTCVLEPVAKDADPLQIGPDVEMDDHTCVLGVSKLTLSFFESAEARSDGLADILEFFGPMMKNFGYSEVAYAWREDGRWMATLEPATEGFDLEAELPRSERELLALVAEALGGEVHVVEL